MTTEALTPIRAGSLRWGLVQALALGVALFVVTVVTMAASNTIFGVSTLPDGDSLGLLASEDPVDSVLASGLFYVILPALIETPFFIVIVRLVGTERVSITLVATVLFIGVLAWLLHGANPTSAGQGASFAILALASWLWGRKLGAPASYLLPIVSHLTWNGCAWLIHATRVFGSTS